MIVVRDDAHRSRAIGLVGLWSVTTKYDKTFTTRRVFVRRISVEFILLQEALLKQSAFAVVLISSMMLAGAPANAVPRISITNISDGRSCSLQAIAQAVEPDDHHSVDISGAWKMSWIGIDGNPKHATLQIKQTKDHIRGTFKGERGSLPITGSVHEDRVSFNLDLQGHPITFNGVVSDDQMSGTTVGDTTWKAVRP